MFPDVLHVPEGGSAAGEVFGVRLHRAGGLYRSGRTITVDEDRWEECERCPAFDGCYKLSMAKLALRSAVQRL